MSDYPPYPHYTWQAKSPSLTVPRGSYVVRLTYLEAPVEAHLYPRPDLGDYVAVYTHNHIWRSRSCQGPTWHERMLQDFITRLPGLLVQEIL